MFGAESRIAVAIMQQQAALNERYVAASGGPLRENIFGFANLLNTNPYKSPAKFPRSESIMDAIMLRRYNARKQIRQAYLKRFVLMAISAPIAACVLIKIYQYAIMWVLS